MNSLPKVIIFGRANTGKSTLFNRLIEQPKALTSKLAGTTRDLNIGQVYWQGINFDLIDTGGIDTILPKKKVKQLAPTANIDFANEIIRRTQMAIKKADLILFTVDVQTGPLPQDRELARTLKKLFPDKDIILVANKTDSLKYQPRSAEFYQLGLGEPFSVSALNGMATGDLLDEVVNKLKIIKKSKSGNKLEKIKSLKIAIIGKPNVGKSSLLNALIGEDRVIVSPIPFTTRESIDTDLAYKGQNFTIIDTAGIRRQANVSQGLEKISVRKSIDNAQSSNICLLVLDISQPLTVQDNKLSDLLMQSKTSIIIIANKWDLIEDKEVTTINKYTNYIYRYFAFLTWAPIVFVSAKSGQHVHKILDLALEINKQRNLKISDSALNKFLKRALKMHRPNQSKIYGRPYLYDLTQVKTNPPRFEIKMSKTNQINPTYIRYLENSLRAQFKLEGVPVSIDLKLPKK
ncbi:MAG: ribosome biogenesis GTPase Der [Candidatus Parcubacteria bacterium]|nr:ribosome biogenesis GTPase Der [Candidatus Parcubacteria bacterium]